MYFHGKEATQCSLILCGVLLSMPRPFGQNVEVVLGESGFDIGPKWE